MEEKRHDTNVTISKPALDRLSEIGWALGIKSRDETGRYLLLKYIKRNGLLSAADRLTHVSTVMRHPLPPTLAEDSVVPTRRLRLRITRSDSRQARDLAFRLPGQAQSRGHTDYQSRLLTDAVMTSIADECRNLGLDPITDQVLAGVHPLLRQRAALGLWRLAVHATRTGAERAILGAAEGSREDRETHGARFGKPPAEPRYVEGLAALLEMNNLDDGEAVWHHSHRFQLVQLLASRFLSTRRDPERWEQALYDQEGDDWQDLRADAITRGPRPRGMRRRVGRPRPGAIGISFEGRGGGAVWRAQRILALPTIVDWLSTSASSTSDRTLDIYPPGWRLALPEDWNPSFIPGPSLGAWAEHIAEHRVLHFDLDEELPLGAPATPSRGHMVWPTLDDDNGEPAPVAGLQSIFRALLDGAVDPRKVAEILLLELMPGSAVAGQKWDDRAAGNPDGPDVSSSLADDSPFGEAWAPPRQRSRPALPPSPSASHTAAVESVTQAPPYPGDVPPLPDLFRAPRAKVAQDDAYTKDDATDALTTEENWYSDWQKSNAGTHRPIPVFVPVEMAQRLGFIDDARAQRLIEDAKARTYAAMNSALRDASRQPADLAALSKAMNDPARFAKLASKLGIYFYEVSAAWCWYVTSLSDEVETNPARLRWLATHLTEVHTRALDREMAEAVRSAARQFAYLHKP